MNRPVSRIAGAAMLALCVLSSPGWARMKTEATGAAVQPTGRTDFLRHPHDSKYYTESWTMILQSDEGHVLYVNFMYSNIGVTSGRSAVSVNLTMPGGQGKPYGWEYDQKDYREDFDGNSLAIGPHSLSLQGRTATFRVEGSELRLHGRLRGWTDGVKFHGGRICLDDGCEDFVQSFFHVPRGDFEGDLSVGGQRVRLKGAGYLDHMVNTEMSSKWSSHWWTVRYFHKDHTVALLAFRPRKDYGSAPILRLLVTDRNRVLALTDRFTLETDQEARDPSKKGHSYATRYRIEAKFPRGTIQGTFTGRRVHERDAVLERLPWAQRTIAQAVAGNPVIYRQEGTPDLVLVLEDGTEVPLTEGTALMESIVN